MARFPYAELHCHSNFSFLDGASHPEELVDEAVRLGLEALALTDHDGFYGVVRFARAASSVGLPTIYGAELSLGLTQRQNGIPDPEGEHIVVLARNPTGYGSLARAISEAQMAGKEKNKPIYDMAKLADMHRGNWLVLSGCRKGAVPKALADGGFEAAKTRALDLVEIFGKDNVAIELWNHDIAGDDARNSALYDIAQQTGIQSIATANAHYATVKQRRLANVVSAIRARRSLEEIDGWLPANGGAYLRSGKEQFTRFWRYDGVVERAAELARQCAFDIKLIAPQLPNSGVPDGHDDNTWLRCLTYKGALGRYGPPAAETVPGAYRQIEHELRLIEQLGFSGYFLIVNDIVEFCRRSDIFCQGRGSAANSAVCYALGITNADAVALGLLFERFLAPERDGPPDIDVDIESDRREEVIQYVYERYGRQRAAQVCNVITYRSRSAVRDVAKAFGANTDQQNAWSKSLDGWAPLDPEAHYEMPASVVEMALHIQDFPRHLGIHSGGMVLCDRPVVEVCPVEWASMENRSVLQWDKDDCATAGLVKFDLLGLGMLSALHYAVDMIRDHYKVDVDIAKLPQQDAVYDMLCKADTIGVFQVESRAQMSTLPRLRPRCFYDLVVEVALIRPGPIQGGSVHPYIRRRNGEEPVTYLHPLLEPSLKKTLGVPLFQEQLMQMAIDVAGFSAGEADQLRQAMGSKRSAAKMERLRSRLYEGMACNGIVGEVADEIFLKLSAFANFGFPESHSVSFAHLVYASSYIKLHYPNCFLASLLNAQPMGFYSPQSLVADACRHGVVVRGPCVNASRAVASIESDNAVRVGLEYVRTIGKELAASIAENSPYVSMEHVVRTNALNADQVEALATAGAFDCFGMSRRSALWSAGAVVQSRPGRLQGVVTGESAPRLAKMTQPEEMAADLWATGITAGINPVELARAYLDKRGAVRVDRLADKETGSAVMVGGVVTHRQRPGTANGVTFLSLEDETGLANVICSVGVWQRFRQIAMASSALIIRGTVEKNQGAVNVVANRLEPLIVSGSPSLKSRNFH